MGLKVRVMLNDEVSFESKSQQDELAEQIDAETFVAPSFVGVHRKNQKHVTVTTKITDLDTTAANEIGEIVANYFDSTVDKVRVQNN